MMVCQMRLEYLKQFNLDLVRVSCKVKMIRDTQIQVSWQPPKELQDIEQEVFPKSIPQQKNYRKRNKVTETKIYSPWKDAILKGNSSSPPRFPCANCQFEGNSHFFPRRSNLGFGSPRSIQFEFVTNYSGRGVTVTASKEVSTTLSLPEAQAPQPLQPWRVLWFPTWRTRCRRLVRLVIVDVEEIRWENPPGMKQKLTNIVGWNCQPQLVQDFFHEQYVGMSWMYEYWFEYSISKVRVFKSILMAYLSIDAFKHVLLST